MAESTNANHSDPGKRTDIMLDDRIEYGYSPTEKRPSGTIIDTLRDWRRPYPMATNMGCKRPISSDDRLFHRSAILESEIDQRAGCIRRQLNSGAGFLKPISLFQHDNAKTAARQ